MLFRPIGQIALAQALGELVFVRGLSLKTIFKKLQKYDEEGGFRMESPSSSWYMVLYDPNKRRILVRGRDLAARLLVYLLGGGIQDELEREKLRADFAAERTIEDQAIDFNGRYVDPDLIKLPQVL